MKRQVFGIAAFAVTFAASAAFGGLCVKDGETVAFLGDSITYFGSQNDGYVDLVKRAFEAKGLKIKTIEAGVPGHESKDMLARLDKVVLRHRPNWMTLMAGVNDVAHLARGQGQPTLERYRENMTAIFDKCAASNVNVIVFTATMFERQGDLRTCKENVLQKSYNDWLRAEAKRRGLPVADVNAAMWRARDEEKPVQSLFLTKDGVHMNAKGQFLLARELLRTMGLPEKDFADVEARAWKPAWVLCKFELKNGASRADYLKGTQALIDAVRKEPGCREYRLLGDFETDWEKPQRFGGRTLWMMEKWESIIALKKHIAGAAVRDLGPALKPLRASSTFHVLEDVLP